jgi:NAD(P)-dependent dehydrogenase (short-subunit alcohol dehydrogenase family)
MVSIVFGGAGGIGAALAKQLVSAGDSVVIASRDEARLKDAASASGAEYFVADATKSAEVDSVFSQVLSRHGRIDSVANCIGSILLKPAHLTSDDEWASTIATNLTTSFHIVRAAVRVMQKQQGGSIVLLASAVARRGMVNHEAIAAAKGGVAALAQSSAASYARYGVRVNCVAPGLVRTPLTRSITENELNLKASVQMHPLGRIGTPEDVASAVYWLLRPEQGWITGQCLGVDGGLSSVQAR